MIAAWPPPGVSIFYAERAWRDKLRANGYRVIDEPWTPEPPETLRPPPAPNKNDWMGK